MYCYTAAQQDVLACCKCRCGVRWMVTD